MCPCSYICLRLFEEPRCICFATTPCSCVVQNKFAIDGLCIICSLSSVQFNSTEPYGLCCQKPIYTLNKVNRNEYVREQTTSYWKHPLGFPQVYISSKCVCLSVGPILVVEPRPITVDVDSDVTLNCKWSGNPPLTLTWTKKGSNMVRTSIQTFNWTLTLKPTFNSDFTNMSDIRI